MALCEVHSDLAQHTKHEFSVHKLADGFLAHHMPHVVDRPHHRDGNRIMRHVLDETAVNFDEIHR